MTVKKLMSSKQAFSAPWAVIIALIGIMFFTAASQYIRLMIIASGVRDAVQSAVIATATENYGNLYNGIREGYAGGYSLTGDSWSERLSGGSVYSRLGRLLGITSNGNKYTIACHKNILTLDERVIIKIGDDENAEYRSAGVNGKGI